MVNRVTAASDITDGNGCDYNGYPPGSTPPVITDASDANSMITIMHNSSIANPSPDDHAATIDGGIAKEVFETILDTGEAANKIVEDRGLKQGANTGVIEAAIDAVIASNPGKVAEHKSSKERLLAFFVGQVMKAMAGKGNPVIVNEILKAKLG
jgi:Glu-tRNA(Gln) amidotransferase subunit E-like FAD-binding protein